MLQLNLYDLENVEDHKLEFAVIVAQYKGEWVFVRHKERTTWEMPGGHREANESVDETAARELAEETGAKEYKLYPICVYSVIRDEIESFGKLFFAEISVFGELPDFEIEEVRLFSILPSNQTYPLIQPFLLNRTIEFLKNQK
ncbi:NUDIX hydrolase [Clostridium thermarum]|uniref:NUDIX hydrolase n=1 Tax=Clostridium thermarum TaxID=1716543 RepID=UPI0013D2D356|nr:NUDIX domain-containing protein [Clostridium thermarum]